MNETGVRQLDFTDVSLYGVTSPVRDPEKTFAITRQLLEGGVDAVQLRTRELTDRETLDLAREMKSLCHEFQALFLLDNRVDLAFAMDADGVHLGHEDMPIEKARELLGHRKIIGASAHSLPQALAAQKQGADYVSCGPIWATPTKPQYKAVGLNLIGLYRAALKVPFVAIGGIDPSNIDRVVEAGASCVAIVRALYDVPSPREAAQFFKDKVLKQRSVV